MNSVEKQLGANSDKDPRSLIEFVFRIDSERHRGTISDVSQSCNQSNLYFKLASEILEGFFEQYMLRESAKYQTN